MSNRRLNASTTAQATRTRVGKLGLTVTVGEVQQRRAKPSLPTVSLEGVKKNRRAPANGRNGAAVPLTDEQAMAAYAYAAVEEAQILTGVVEAKARLKAQANPKPVEPPVRHDVAEVVTSYTGAGRDRSKEPERRALTHCERQHLKGTLTFEETQTATSLRNRFLAELGHSEGVASYGDPNASGPAWRKADRRAQAIMGRNRSNRSMLADLPLQHVRCHGHGGPPWFRSAARRRPRARRSRDGGQHHGWCDRRYAHALRGHKAAAGERLRHLEGVPPTRRRTHGPDKAA